MEQYRPEEDGIGQIKDPDEFDRKEAESVASNYLLMMRSAPQVAYKE